MPETKKIAFNFKEITTMLIKQQDIHEGYWGIYFEFAMVSGLVPFPPCRAPVPPPDTPLMPAAIIPITKIGITKFDTPNPLTVDAAQVNPLDPTKLSESTCASSCDIKRS
jgi:hypothetical protein